jgi:hypothetical protein
VQGMWALQVRHNIIMTDMMAQAGALQLYVITTVADYGDEQVTKSRQWVQGTRVLQVGHNIIMVDRMEQAGALRPYVITTVADYGDEQVNR